MMRATTRPVNKSYVRLWLGALVTLGYILIILFTLQSQKRKELNEALQRVELPSGVNRLPKVVAALELPVADRRLGEKNRKDE